MKSEGKKIIQNIFWLMFDKAFILLLQFFVGIKVANHYGATLFGKYSYAISIIAFSNIFFELINGRIIKKYYTDKNFNEIVYNINFFKNTISLVIFIVVIILNFIYKFDKILFMLLIFLSLDNILITATSGIENFFEFKLEARRIVISNNIVKLISYTIQYFGIIFNQDIVFIAIVSCFGSFLRLLIIKYQYKYTYLNNIDLIKEKIKLELLKKMINESKYLWLTFISFLAYTQTDKIMIKSYLGLRELGIYTIGMQLSSVLAILIVPIQNSLFPKFLKLYREDYKKYYNFYLISNMIITQIYLIITFISIVVVNYSFQYVYSKEYTGAIIIYSILAFSILFKANGSLQSSHMTIKNITKKSFYKTLLSLVVNIILNMILIPKLGINGAAIATLVTQFIALFLIDFFIEEYKEQAIIQLKSFNTIYFFKNFKSILKKKER